MNLVEEIKNSLRKGNVLYRLIFINVAIFVVLGIWFVIIRLFTPGVTLEGLRMAFSESVLKYLMIPSLPREILFKPWTIITYMFAHFNLWHILMNMLMLYWFGRIFLQYLTAKQLLSTYILGGLAGAALYVVFVNSFPGLRDYLGGAMLGASAAIMAIVVSIAVYVPNYTIYLFFLGPVRLKYIAIGFVIIDVLMIASDNAGGNIAHLGGAVYGFWFTSRLRKGKDSGLWISRIIDKITTLFKPRPRLNVAYRKTTKRVSDEEYNRRKISEQKEIDRILDKIAKGGYESLTKNEKETLFKMSNKS
ncbi:MAG TPA: rhomboid family intramembrane serine protease [Bacteroidales bacterium]|jgi:membrane associated rhomboid family serine protease|nr:rhomboid family intramembrane serine protease [Bacteroidales bacterium]